MGGRCGRLSREMKSSDFHFKRITLAAEWHKKANKGQEQRQKVPCLLYTSDAADDWLVV